MSSHWLESIPEALRDNAREAVHAGIGTSDVVRSMEPILGGASGAVAYRIDAGGRNYLLRMETRRSPLRNPHQYRCMRIAAEAGIAPAVRYENDAAGTALLDYVAHRPLQEYPGGPVALASALGTLAARLQAAPQFPVLGDYRVFIDRLFGHLKKVFVSGLLDSHAEAYAQIREVYPWDDSSLVSSHNDPNPRNILFDGERLWLIDWETSYRNDPLTDVAILAENHATTPEVESVLLSSWLGRPPDRVLGARLLLMRLLTRLYYAGLLIATTIREPSTLSDLAAPTPEEFQSMIASGPLKAGSNEVKVVLGRMVLASFLAGVRTAEFQDALTIAKLG